MAEKTLIYKNIYNGQEIKLTAKEYEENYLLDASAFYEYFIVPNMDLIDSIKSDEYGGTVLYTIKYKELDQLVCLLFGPLKNAGVPGKDDKRMAVSSNIELRDDAIYFAISGYNAGDKNLYILLKEGVAEFIQGAQKGKTYSSLWFSYEALEKIYSDDSYLWIDGKGRSMRGFSSKIQAKQIHKEILVYSRHLLSIISKKNITTQKLSTEFLSNQPLQQIFYGAPGTGKSYTINRETKGRMTFRTTFHPDSDYSTFVGAYKPVMEEVETRVVPVVLSNGAAFDQNCGTLKERRISYKFVKQTFMKAYIAAWRAFINNSNVTITTQTPSPLSLSSDDQTWILEEVTNDKVLYTKEEIISVEEYRKEVLGYWGNMPDPDEKGKMKLTPFDHYKATACVWYREKHGKNHSADECWKAIMNVLEAGGVIEATPNSQTYSISLRGDKLVVVTRNNKTYRETIKKSFENAETDSSVHKRIAKELKDRFDANDFDNAWEQLKKAVNEVEVPESINTTEVPPVFLIIEEINRGNCAQIFGDLFQLLDREKGFSQYPIHADEDIRKCLLSQHTDEDPSFGVNGLELTSEQKTLINSILDCEDDVADKIAHGEVLVLPPNLYIWATMNTSDQSLFPIDSAFKRRWDWVYVPISKGVDEKGNDLNWNIVIGEKSYDWWDFLEAINDDIGTETSSEDKKLGFFFCKADENNIISVEKFVSKVLFYLWNDVFKMCGKDYKVRDEKGDETDKLLTFDKFYKKGGFNEILVQNWLENDLKLTTKSGSGLDDNGDLTDEEIVQNSMDRSKYKVNNGEEVGKTNIPFEAVKAFVKDRPKLTPEEIVDEWKKIDAISYIVETKGMQEERRRSRAVKDTKFDTRSKVLETENGVLYVSNQVRIKNVDSLIDQIHAQGWGIEITKVTE